MLWGPPYSWTTGEKQAEHKYVSPGFFLHSFNLGILSLTLSPKPKGQSLFLSSTRCHCPKLRSFSSQEKYKGSKQWQRFTSEPENHHHCSLHLSPFASTGSIFPHVAQCHLSSLTSSHCGLSILVNPYLLPTQNSLCFTGWLWTTTLELPLSI